MQRFAHSMIYRYNIHNIFIFDIVDRRHHSLRHLIDINRRYQAFSVPVTPDVSPDLMIEVGPFTPSLAGCNVLDDKYYIKSNYLYHAGESGKLGGVWQFEVTGLEDEACRVRVNANLSGMPFIPGRVIDFFIQYMLTQRGCSLIHASAVTEADKAVMYSGRGGGGKTTIALEAVEGRGCNYLGDNFIICKNGQLFSFHSDLNIFGYNLRPNVWQNLSRTERWFFKIWRLVYYLSGGYIKVFTSISPARVFPHNLQSSAKLTMFNSLLTGPEFAYKPIQRAEIIGRTVSNQKLEFFFFVRHIELYSCILPDSDFARHWEIYERRLNENLPADIPYYQITMPERITREVIHAALDLNKAKF